MDSGHQVGTAVAGRYNLVPAVYGSVLRTRHGNRGFARIAFYRHLCDGRGTAHALCLARMLRTKRIDIHDVRAAANGASGSATTHDTLTSVVYQPQNRFYGKAVFAFEINPTAASLRVTSREVFYVILRSVRRFLLMRAHFTVTVHAANISRNAAHNLGYRNDFPSPLTFVPDDVLPTLFATEHQVMWHKWLPMNVWGA
jgi:hypothetical protein